MSTTSLHLGIVDFYEGGYGDGLDPAGTTIARDGVANGLLHAADSIGQVRVNYHPVAFGSRKGYSEIGVGTTPQLDTYHQFEGSPFGPWPLTLRNDASGYLYRVRIGCRSDAQLDGQNTIRVTIAPLVQARVIGMAANSPYAYVYETSWSAFEVDSTTVKWRDGLNQGELKGYITISADQVRAWGMESVSIFNAINGAVPRSIDAVMVGAFVSGMTTHTGTLPRLHALHISESIV